MDFAPNHLYYGDCLDVMDSWPNKSIDLVYLDPPSNSNATALVLQMQNTEKSDAALEVLTDIRTWNVQSQQRLKRLSHTKHPAERAIRAAAISLEHSGGLAYLTYIVERLTIIKRILKPTGAIYLHCDSTFSHYLKPVMDVLFGPENYRNEIIWCPTGGRTIPNNPNPKNFSKSSDTILFYGMPKHQFKACYEPDPDAEKRYSQIDEHGRRFTLKPLWRSPIADARPNLNYEWRGYVNPYPSGWFMTKEKLEQLYHEGRIYFRNNKPHHIHYMDEDKGRPIGNVWNDINRLQSINREFLGYPTQKPLALLERILKASSSEGDLILDPFCGCGTTIEAGLKLGRQVIGIDISMFALDVINTGRLAGKYPPLPIKGFCPDLKTTQRSEIQQSPSVQFPNDFKPAAPGEDSDIIYQLREAFKNNFELFSDLVKKEKERHQFQDWAVQQIGLIPNSKKSGEGNIDGAGKLVNVPYDNYEGIALVQVTSKKSRNWRAEIERFCYTLESKNAACGVFITLHPIGTRSPAHKIAEDFGNITVDNATYPRLQLWSVKGFYETGTRPNLPPMIDPYKD